MFHRSLSISFASVGTAALLLLVSNSMALADSEAPSFDNYYSNREVADSNALKASSFAVVNEDGPSLLKLQIQPLPAETHAGLPH